MKVLVAMSGGVDSSVAAALMLEAGHDVVGVTLKQWQGPNGEMPTSGCCTVSDAEDARRVAAQLGIPYYVLDYTEEFREAVVDRFGAGYLAGRTPNPCVECNRRVRFHALLDRARELGCAALATGHHARVQRGGDGRFRLMAGRDRGKDQSYVLHMLGQAELSSVLLPVGELTKSEVRSKAAVLGLRTADKPDSQDICFVDGDYRDFLTRYFPDSARAGDIVDGDGEVVGRHDGTAGFTIGQRRGLGVAAGEPRYVVAIRPDTSTIVIGPREELRIAGVRVEDVTWVAGRPPASPVVEVKVRYRAGVVPALVSEVGLQWHVWFDGEAAAPGQAAVFYNGDEVLGGGTIVGTIERG
jgi:tRNA-specific 2-thiouridylase